MCCCKIINLKTTSKENKIPPNGVQWRIIRGGNSWVVGGGCERFLNCSFLLVMSSKSSLGWGIYHRGWWTISLKMKTSFLEKRKHVTETHKNQHKMIHFDHFFLYFNFSSVCLFLVALNGTSFLSGLPESRLEFQRAWPHRHLWTIFTSCFFAMGLSFQLIWAIEMLLEAGNLHNYRK